MKKIIKNPIFTFILGALIFGGIVGVSAYTILATDIGFTPKDSTWKKSNGEDITNVKDAIDELYSKANSSSSLLNKICTYQSEGSYGQKGQVGALYDCEVGPNIHKNFYILTIRDKELDMIMDRNINNSSVDWYTATSFYKNNSEIQNWNNVLNIDIPSCQEIVDFLNPSYDIYTTDWFSIGTNDKKNYSELNSEQKQLKRNLAWLFNYTKNCYENGCDEDKSLDGGSEGYWLKEVVPNTNYAKMLAWGSVTNRNVGDNSLAGIRPIITVLKSQLN